ncbi:MAG TPA: hypothetical protein VMS65_11085 [Polyangiaceae bacterium]|nr:hypothetical protein [Polyangiaceae bacterium]
MRRWALFGWVLFCSVACGGGNKEPASPDAESESAESASAESTSSGDEGVDDSVRKAAGTPDAKGGPPPAGATQSADDATAVLELVVNDPELDPYLKLGEPGRFPLKISGSALPSGVKLVKATEPVQVVSGPKDKKDPVLVFTEVDISGKKASVRYRYDIEGIRGSANLTKGQYGWELTNSRVVENK